jgi:hypothetical protein
METSNKNNRPTSKKNTQKSLTMRETSGNSSWVIPDRKPLTLRGGIVVLIILEININ